MLMHGDHKMESMLLNIGNPDWQQQVEQEAVAILAMLCLDLTGELTRSTGCGSWTADIWVHKQT